MKNIIVFIFAIILSPILTFPQVYHYDNDECSNAANFGGFGTTCSPIDIAASTTVGSGFNAQTDIFSCDSSVLKSSVFFTFITGVAEVEFNLLRGFNINVSVMEIGETEDCNPANLELTNNCFTGINAYCHNTPTLESKVLFTNLTIGKEYKLAVWTDEKEQTDFEFCLARAPQYECGDGECYQLAENVENCPGDCNELNNNLTPTNDACSNSLRFNVNSNNSCVEYNTTIGATFNDSTDLFSCDADTLKASVFYEFNTSSPNVEFNLIEGENINVTLLVQYEDSCNPSNLELTENCFINLNAGTEGLNEAEALFTNLTPFSFENFTTYVLAIWTSQDQATDFKFTLNVAPEIECGDSVCYQLLENPETCPTDCLNTSIEQYLNEFQIYPNPVINNIYIKNKKPIASKTTINILSINGKLSHHESLTYSLSEHKINLQQLTQGVYFLHIISDDVISIQKFLKMN